MEMESAEDFSPGAGSNSGRHTGSLPPFLAKTLEMLETPLLSEYIGWNEAGDTLVVRKVSCSRPTEDS